MFNGKQDIALEAGLFGLWPFQQYTQEHPWEISSKCGKTVANNPSIARLPKCGDILMINTISH